MLALLLLVPLFLISYFIYHFVIKIYLTAWRYKKMDPSLKLYIAPFTGMLGVQKQNIEKYGDSQRFMKDMIKQNPDQKAYCTNLGSYPFLILCDAQLVREVHQNYKNFKKFNVLKHSKLSYDKGIFLAEDQPWTNMRGIIRHSFSHEQLKGMINPMINCIKSYNERLKERVQQSSNKTIDFKVIHDTQTLIGQILVRIFFSEQGSKKKIGDTPLSIALAQCTVDMFTRSRSGSNILFNLFFGKKAKDLNFSKEDKELYNDMSVINQKIQQILDARLALENDPEDDFLRHYIREMRKNDQLIAQAEAKGEKHSIHKITKQEILHQLTNFYFAGIDTTGHLIAFAIYALAEFPQHKSRIIEEIKTNFSDLNGITYESLGKLEFMNRFLDQCLRMWAPATGILARQTKKDVQIGPFSLPEGSLVGTNIIGLMHNPKYYDNPEIFNPDRWATKGAHTSQAYSFIPFSAGSRSCIGKYLALMETKLILIYLLNNFDVERTEVPLRLHARFLYEPIDQDLVRIKIGGMGLK